MKSLRLFFAAALLVPASSLAQDAFTHEVNGFLFSQGDFNADGRRDLVVVDRNDGTIRLITQTASQDFTWGAAQPSGIESPAALSVGKFYLATHDAIAVGSPVSNRIHLFGLTNPAEVFTPKEIYPAYPGPSSLAAFDVNGTGTADLVSIGEGLAPLVNKGPGKVYEALVDLTASTPGIAWTRNFGSVTERVNPVRPKAGVAPRICEIYFGPGQANGVMYFESVGPGGLSNAINTGSIPSDSRYAAGSLDASSLSHFLFWSPGQPLLRCIRLNESVPGTFSFGTMVSHSLPAGIAMITPVKTGTGARIAVLFSNGDVRIYDFDGLSAPVERAFILGLGTDFLLPLADDGFLTVSRLRGSSPLWRRFAPSGGGYLPAAQGTIPRSSAARQVSNILFLSAEPFVNPGVSPRLLTHFGEWTTSTSPGFGIAWNINSLIDGGSTNGLGGSTSITLSGSAGGEFPLVNQYSSELSIYSFDTRTGQELADIVFSPPSGTYPPVPPYPVVGNELPPSQSDLQIQISATESGYPLFYRLSTTGDYLAVPSSGRIEFSGTRTVQAFGRKADGTRTPVRSATYTIADNSPLALAASADSDADGLPDAWEDAFGLEDPAADADQDGFSQLEEHLGGSDPHSFTSIPDEIPTLTGRVVGNLYRLEWPAGDTLSMLKISSDLSQWTPVATGITVAGNKRRLDVSLDPAGTPKLFFRLER